VAMRFSANEPGISGPFAERVGISGSFAERNVEQTDPVAHLWRETELWAHLRKDI